MAVNSPRGFEASHAFHGGGSHRTRRYRVSADNAQAIFKGDLVSLNTAGGLTSWQLSDASALSAMDPVLGVVKALYDTNGKPLTFSQPTKGPYLDASTGGYADVYDDPEEIFIANASASASGEMIGKFAPVAFGANNSAAGISGWGVDLTVVASAVGNTPLMVVGVAEFDGFPDQIAGGATNNDVYVKIADHHYRRHINLVGSDS